MTDEFTLDIQKLTDRARFLKTLVYGESGSGKTVFASTAPRPILWLESEGGTSSIGDGTDIDVAKVAGLDSYREALKYLLANPEEYKTVVIDSLSETQAAVLKDIMNAVLTIDPSRDEFNPQFPEWGRLTGVTREIARAFRDLPMHLVITTLQREDTDAMTGRTKVRPRLSPTMAEELPGFMDAVLYLYAASANEGEVGVDGIPATESGITIVRNGLLAPTGKYIAKLRAPQGSNPPAYLRDPDFPKVFDLIFPKKPKAKSTPKPK